MEQPVLRRVAPQAPLIVTTAAKHDTLSQWMRQSGYDSEAERSTNEITPTLRKGNESVANEKGGRKKLVSRLPKGLGWLDRHGPRSNVGNGS